MKIYFDTKPLRSGHAVRGIGYYTKNLLENLKKSKNVDLVDDPGIADIVHYPYFDLFFSSLHVGKKPTVVTVFDTIPLIYPERYPPGIKGRINFLRQKRELKKVEAIITISETSKKDIVRFLGIPQNKVLVVPLAASDEFKKMENGKWKMEVRKKYNLPEKFVLYVGDVNYNKNLISLVKACKSLNTSLVIVGKQAASEDFDKNHIENKELLHLIKAYGEDKEIIRLGFVSTEDVVSIYNLATVYCQPSLYEGFGLPVLEAMKCGTPVVAAKTQALVEIAENAALFVNSKDVSDIKRGLNEVIKSPSLRRELSQLGVKKVKEYSWEKTAAETVQVYLKLFK